MKSFIRYIKEYLRHLSIKSFFITFFFIAALVTMNYTIGIERPIRHIQPWYLSLLSFFFFYGFVFFFAWAIQYSFPGNPYTIPADTDNIPNLPSVRTPGYLFPLSQTPSRKKFLLLLLLAPLYFALKMVHWNLLPLLPSGWSAYWYRYSVLVLELPAKFLLLITLLFFLKPLLEEEADLPPVLPGTKLSPFFGWSTRFLNTGPYLLLLACMLPLIALASTRPDFLQMYPKMKNIAFLRGHTTPLWPWQLLYELSYSIDFLSIELFFRGFLVVGLIRYAGHRAILPMAAFYCTVHFGKPLGECISSFFGGLILGIIAARTRSIFGGLIVHLGIAWLMEAGGFLGATYLH